MAERHDTDPAQYSETTDPRNPPNAVLQKPARRKAVRTFVGGIVAVFLVVAALFAYRSVTGPAGEDDVARPEPSAVGTTTSGAESPGGFDPIPQAGSTQEEIEFRGGDGLGGTRDASGGEPLTGLDALGDDSRQPLAGRRIDLQDVEVESAQDGTFVVRDGDVRATVVAPAGSPDVRAGQNVNLSGTVESGGAGARIRATRVEVR